tara:strand:- start:2629 stop:3081 length:453 start_codon:yes stop_codon:yes gene_type:complete
MKKENGGPAFPAAEVPLDLVTQWLNDWGNSSCLSVLQLIANRAAAYGREQAQWVPVSERLPPPNQKVLVHYTNAVGKGRTVCGFHCGEKERDSEDYGGFEDGGDWSDDGEHFYWPAGWYEEIDNWEDYSAVAICYGEPTHWRPLPEPPTC